ncbi:MULTISPECIES: Gfo/Idh/MocA family oxidoreductase [unclassified Streptomyces]|uniref:Gfo/Idh/MocA family protein n=1 Tax=unclassified Streptomyces TaxID=2593676 RepID=UPI0001C1B184|nr:MULTISPECIES: Gfo/Idh/MocA family oxidoreductase [unclassified Streptomyces]AEN14158.1 oxidoreductase domain protein [Streptomyces sp. SirexAA-E]MYR66818.1 Gfo/Idh/MocA family oxidoreductase [Streptomyces sp. SID4939]MYS03618.1 Gfo/Idh/MocA family oxidoreductase [Streptomyces sp. SID4940]MYT66032.1 Gfo/Idh/MocA family oxidoreductase [Streptomyces sp. SID8357]MYT88892.1 Gfo/Idh/MocA family oxidoreductase [Streptomyces sp. SID8360]
MPGQGSGRGPVRVAIVGTGAIARVGHLPALTALAAEQPLEIVAAVDVAQAAVDAFCAEAGIPHPYTDLDRMLAEQRPDLVSLCTPPRFHRDQAVAALRAGAWVWCEKPPCPSLEDFDAIEAAEGPGGGGPYAAIVFQHRFGSGAGHVRELLARQALGRPLVAHCQTTWYRDEAYYSVPWRGGWDSEGGGPAMGHGIHQMDLLLDLLGPWAEIHAMAGRLVHDVETEDVSTALVRFRSGAMATVVNSVLSPDEVSRIRIDCERATVELTHLYGHRNADWRITPAPGVPDGLASSWTDFGADVPSSHEAQLRGLLADLRAGRRPRSSGGDGRKSLELVAALYKAAFTGATVRAGEIVPGDPYYSALHGDAPGWAPAPPPTAEATA